MRIISYKIDRDGALINTPQGVMVAEYEGRECLKGTDDYVVTGQFKGQADLGSFVSFDGECFDTFCEKCGSMTIVRF